MPEIFVATAADLEALVPPDHPRRSSLVEAIQGNRCLVTRSEGRAVAHLVMGGGFFGHPFIETVFVAEAHRHRGHGRALLSHAVWIHAGMKLFTSTNASNAVMRTLLLSERFVESGWIDNLDPGDPEIVFCHLP